MNLFQITFVILCVSPHVSTFQSSYVECINSYHSKASPPRLSGWLSNYKGQAPIVSSTISYRLAANKDSAENDIKGFPIALPTLNQAVFSWLLFVSFNRLRSLPYLDMGDNDLMKNLAFNGIFFVGSIFALVKSFAKIDYESLDDLKSNSLAQQAGRWSVNDAVPSNYEQFEVASFAGGCFWGTELHYQRIPGVVATCVGYTQGAVDRPTYEQVSSGFTGHTEGIQLLYDPSVVSYERLLNKLFGTIDPTLLNQVGNDRGTQYRHGIYYHTDQQLDVAKKFIAENQPRFTDPIVTQLNPATVFWPAENYHQRHLEKGGQSAEKECEEKVRCYG